MMGVQIHLPALAGVSEKNWEAFTIGPSPTANRLVTDCLTRVLASQAMGKSTEPPKLLVHCTVLSSIGNYSDLKEVLIASALLPNKAGYNPAIDNGIRAIAADLRARLAKYYKSEGRADPIEFRMFPGAYKVHIIDRRVTVILDQFKDWSLRPTADAEYLSSQMRSELSHRLKLVSGLLLNEATSSGPRFHVNAYLVPADETVTVYSPINCAATGRVIGVPTLQRHRDDWSRLTAELASSIVAGIQPHVNLELIANVRFMNLTAA